MGAPASPSHPEVVGQLCVAPGTLLLEGCVGESSHNILRRIVTTTIIIALCVPGAVLSSCIF